MRRLVHKPLKIKQFPSLKNVIGVIGAGFSGKIPAL
jgi:hypothetical protein